MSWIVLAWVLVISVAGLVGLKLHKQQVQRKLLAKKLVAKEAKRARRQQRRAERVRENIEAWASPPPGQECRPVILVVDDSRPAQIAIKKTLESKGYRVMLANNGRSAWAILQDKKPDMVISDIEMPQMNGLALARLIRQDLSLADVPVMLITAHLEYNVKEVGPSAGIAGFMPKPWNKDDLLEQVGFLLRENQAVAV